MGGDTTGGRIERLRSFARRHGTAASLRRVLGSFARRILFFDMSRLLWLSVERLEADPPDEPGLAFRFLPADEVRRFAADAGNHLSAESAEQVQSESGHCFAALCDGRLASYGWYALGAVDPRHCGGVALRLPPDVAYFYNGFTRPEFRGRQLYGRLMGRGLRALGDRGIRSLLASVNWTNAAALRSSFRLGYVDLGYFVGLGPGRWRRVFPPRAALRRGIRFKQAGTSRWCS
jgi:GNAT superfamily N-acetyltransferase